MATTAKGIAQQEKLNDISIKLQELKAANEQLKELKQAEQEHQRKYFLNCAKVMAMLKDKRKDFVLESLSQLDASVGAISMDVQAFKNIRNYLFAQITDEIHRHKASQEQNQSRDESLNADDSRESHQQALTKNKLYLYLFHLFESVVNNVAQLVQKTKYTILSQCGESVNVEPDGVKTKKNTISDTINTIATGSELVTIDKENKGGFFSENAKMIAKSSLSIEKAMEKISKQLIVVDLNGNESRKMHEKVQSFIDQLPPLQNDTSFEVRWSLSELEDIVFEFINAHDLPNEFKAAMPWNKEGNKGGKGGEAKKDSKVATLKRSVAA